MFQRYGISQTRCKKADVLQNEDTKTLCFITEEGWKRNPKTITNNLNETSTNNAGDASNAKAFGSQAIIFGSREFLDSFIYRLADYKTFAFRLTYKIL